MNKQNVTKGLIGVLCICIAAGVSMPMPNVYRHDLTVFQFLAIRGLMTAAICWLLMMRFPVKFDRNIFWLSGSLLAAAVSYFLACRIGNVGLTTVIVATAPAVNCIIAWRRNKKVPASIWISLAVLIIGITLALQPWQLPFVFSIWWLLFCVIALVTIALYFESLGVSKHIPDLDKCFWQGLGLGLFSLVASIRDDWQSDLMRWELIAPLLVFGLVAGIFYFKAYLYTFGNFSVEIASVLAMAEVPVIIVSAGWMLGEQLNALQWGGVLIAVSGECYLCYWLAKQRKQPIGVEV